MKKIYIHTGQQKTGTSSLQRVLYENRSKLNEEGFSFFTIDPQNRVIKDGNTGSWIQMEKRNAKDDATIVSPDVLAKKLAELPHDVIISTEWFTWIFNEQELIKFKEELSKFFNKIIIVVYIRRQDQQIISFYQQLSKKCRADSSFFNESEPVAMPIYNKNLDYYFNYNERISRWGNVFGNENIIIRVFDRKTLYQGDIVKDFCHLLKIKNIPSSVNENISNGFEMTKVSHLMSKVKMREDLRIRIEKNLDNSGKLMPSREEAKKFYLKYKESNKQLNERFKINDSEYIFNDDFSMYSDLPMDRWTEESANQAIKHILQSVNDLKAIDYFKLGIKSLLKKVQ